MKFINEFSTSANDEKYNTKKLKIVEFQFVTTDNSKKINYKSYSECAGIINKDKFIDRDISEKLFEVTKSDTYEFIKTDSIDENHLTNLFEKKDVELKNEIYHSVCDLNTEYNGVMSVCEIFALCETNRVTNKNDFFLTYSKFMNNAYYNTYEDAILFLKDKYEIVKVNIDNIVDRYIELRNDNRGPITLLKKNYQLEMVRYENILSNGAIFIKPFLTDVNYSIEKNNISKFYIASFDYKFLYKNGAISISVPDFIGVSEVKVSKLSDNRINIIWVSNSLNMTVNSFSELADGMSIHFSEVDALLTFYGYVSIVETVINTLKDTFFEISTSIAKYK
jgi:hypothetical protein